MKWGKLVNKEIGGIKSYFSHIKFEILIRHMSRNVGWEA